MRQSRENMHHTHMHRNLCIIQMTPKLCLKHWGRLNSRQVRVNQKTNDFRNTQREGRLMFFATTAYRPVSPVTNLVDSPQKKKTRAHRLPLADHEHKKSNCTHGFVVGRADRPRATRKFLAQWTQPQLREWAGAGRRVIVIIYYPSTMPTDLNKSP